MRIRVRIHVPVSTQAHVRRISIGLVKETSIFDEDGERCVSKIRKLEPLIGELEERLCCLWSTAAAKSQAG